MASYQPIWVWRDGVVTLHVPNPTTEQVFATTVLAFGWTEPVLSHPVRTFQPGRSDAAGSTDEERQRTHGT